MPKTAAFEVAATVLPVLFLALVYQDRTWEREDNIGRSGVALFATRVALLVVLSASESVALRVVGTDDPTQFQWALVALGLSLSVALIAQTVLRQAFKQQHDDFPDWMRQHKEL